MPVNNNDIINRLIENQKESNLLEDTNTDPEQNAQAINKSRIASLKYKLYLFLVVV